MSFPISFVSNHGLPETTLPHARGTATLAVRRHPFPPTRDGNPVIGFVRPADQVFEVTSRSSAVIDATFGPHVRRSSRDALPQTPASSCEPHKSALDLSAHATRRRCATWRRRLCTMDTRSARVGGHALEVLLYSERSWRIVRLPSRPPARRLVHTDLTDLWGGRTFADASCPARLG